MKIKLALLLSTILPSFGADFVNLTFDQPNLTGSLTPIFPGLPSGPFRGNTSDLLPGWTVLANQVPQTIITYAPPGTSFDGHVNLVEYRVDPAGQQLSQFALLLESSPPNQASLALKQTGTIPANAATLGLFANHLLEVRVNEQTIYTVDPNFTAYPAVDVSRFAGQTVDLEFRVIQGPFETVSINLDIFGFQPVPEPSTWALLGLGATALLWWSKRRNG